MVKWKRAVCAAVAVLAAVTLLAGYAKTGGKESAAGSTAESNEPIVMEAESEVTIVS